MMCNVSEFPAPSQAAVRFARIITKLYRILTVP